ncbi:hypothetical protein ABL78_4440 [Leptomonas seymouri]|uniref:Uncharacterized protein n=1 Tax=Leptomonas seymouri TaxID=5684 RepID=A0A0N1IKQ8_LEPSE|nr:hypothetical protein ABL78_4440 [Leptomonas seymouri]|eukprot:KPI86500.1 hypothetical protein ABL78_4440 [Leptomonas seymouri]
MSSTNSIAALTSYIEVPPAVPRFAPKKPNPARTGPIFLSSITTRGRHSSKQPLTPDSSTSSMKMSAASQAGDARATASRDDAWDEKSDGVSLPLSDSTPISARELAAREPASSCASSGRWSSNVSRPRTSHADADLISTNTTPTSAPHTSFTAHLRQCFALYDASKDKEGEHNLSNIEIHAEESQLATPRVVRALPRIYSARGLFPSSPSTSPASKSRSMSSVPAAASAETRIRMTSLRSKSVVKLVDPISPTVGKGSIAASRGVLDGATDDKVLEALSNELTELLQKADAAVEKLAENYFALRPEQLRYLTRMQQLISRASSVPELHRGELVSPPIVSPRISITNALGAAPESSAQSSDCLSHPPACRFLVRPPCSVTRE